MEFASNIQTQSSVFIFECKVLRQAQKRPDQASVRCEINLWQNYILLLVTITAGQQ